MPCLPVTFGYTYRPLTPSPKPFSLSVFSSFCGRLSDVGKQRESARFSFVRCEPKKQNPQNNANSNTHHSARRSRMCEPASTHTQFGYTEKMYLFSFLQSAVHNMQMRCAHSIFCARTFIIMAVRRRVVVRVHRTGRAVKPYREWRLMVLQRILCGSNSGSRRNCGRTSQMAYLVRNFCRIIGAYMSNELNVKCGEAVKW